MENTHTTRSRGKRENAFSLTILEISTLHDKITHIHITYTLYNALHRGKKRQLRLETILKEKTAITATLCRKKKIAALRDEGVFSLYPACA
jgi:superfamily I DNA and RNA helicase